MNEEQSGPRRPAGGPGGLVFPSPVVLLSIVAVAMAAIAFFATRGAGSDEREVGTPVSDRSSSHATSDPTDATDGPSQRPSHKPKPIKRGKIAVEVYNNSGITGLAGQVGEQAGEVGWNVTGVDNWYGSVPANTVYFPPDLKRAAKQLALDLGIGRTAPIDGAMKPDRLTVILTGALS